MIPNIIRLKDNKYYILYKRHRDMRDTIPLYVVYRTDEYEGGIAFEHNWKDKAERFFNKATKEAIQYELELNDITMRELTGQTDKEYADSFKMKDKKC